MLTARTPARGDPPVDARATMLVVSDLLLALIVVLILVLIWRGPKTLPEIGRMFGRGVREAREEMNKARGDDSTTGAGPAA